MSLDTFGDLTYYKIPPQSTGGNVSHRRYAVLEVSGIAGVLRENAQFVTNTNVSGFISESIEIPVNRKRLTVVVERDSSFHSFSVGSPDSIEITQPDGTVLNGTIDKITELLLPVAAITDPTNPATQLSISDLGSAAVTFNEGEPQLDAFGLLRVSSASSLGSYQFTSEIGERKFGYITDGTATIERDINASVLNFDIGTNNGDRAVATSNNFHKYYTGFSTQVLVSCFCGDSGKDNVVRRWGYYDNEDGAYFELQGSTFNLVIRRSTSGSVEEIRIPQSTFNNDIVDGSAGNRNKSGLSLNLDANNLYFIDFSWLGSGSIRFGVYSNGRRIILHSAEELSNTAPNPYWKNATLPVTFEIFNTSSTGSPSRFSLICSNVSTEAFDKKDVFDDDGINSSWLRPTALNIPNNAIETFVAALRAMSSFNGEKNRKKITPKRLNVNISGNSSVLLKVYYRAVITDANWQQVLPTVSTVEFDLDGNIAFPGVLSRHFFLDPGSHVLDFGEFFNTRANFVSPSNGDASPIVLITAESIEDNPVSVRLGAEWVEI